MKKKWYVIYTKSNCEKKVAASLTRKGIENYCPLNRIVNTNWNKKRILSEPLFPSFIFVYVSDTEISIVRQIGSVVNFIYWLGTPAVIKDAEIEHIQHFTNQSFNIKIKKTNVNPNEAVKISNEPYIDINNNGILISAKLNFKLSLPSLGYVMIFEMEKSTNEVFNYGFERSRMLSYKSVIRLLTPILFKAKFGT